MGKPRVDLSASHLSHQLPRYMSWELDPCCMAVDALQQKWTHMFYGFPSIFSNRESFKENPRGQSCCDLITPTWQSQPWCPGLLQMSIRNPILLPNNTLLLNPQGSTHPLFESGSFRLAAWLISSNEWRQREYLKMLQSSSQMPEGQVHKRVMNRPGISGLASVHRDRLILFDAL